MEIITFPNAIVWLKDINQNDLLSNFSPRHAKRLSTSIPKLEENNIEYSINEIDDVFLGWFENFYLETMGDKSNPNPRNIRETIDRYKGKSKCFGLKITENDTTIGGAIYINKTNRVTTAFKALKSNWETAKLQVSPSLLAEYILYTHARTFGYSSISHGQDSNPYGYNSDIGLCSFKLSLGYKPFTKKIVEVSSISTDDISSKCLILNLPTSGRAITTADLFISEAELPLVEMLLKYEERLRVKTHLL